jgi:hypothetical protein
MLAPAITIHSIIYKCLFLFFFTSINVYTHWSHWRTTSIFTRALFSPLNIISRRWNCMTGCQRNLYSSRAVCGPQRRCWIERKPKRAIELENLCIQQHLIRFVVFFVKCCCCCLGCNQVEWMWHHSPLSIHKYISLYERVYKVSKKESGQRSSSTRESQRAMMLAREYIS